MTTLEENRQESVCNKLCETCPHFRDYGDFEVGWHYPQYIPDWECELELTPRDEDCPQHKKYVDECSKMVNLPI